MKTITMIREPDQERDFVTHQALQRLQVFVGNWEVEGQNLKAAPKAAGANVKGTESWEWLSGNFFLIYAWNRQFGDQEHVGIGITHYDPALGIFICNNYDNAGFCRRYRLEIDNGGWKFTGSEERANIEFSADGNSFIESWEILDHDNHWQPLCTLKGSKITDQPASSNN